MNLLSMFKRKPDDSVIVAKLLSFYQRQTISWGLFPINGKHGSMKIRRVSGE
jgi:hypothetical protein